MTTKTHFLHIFFLFALLLAGCEQIQIPVIVPQENPIDVKDTRFEIQGDFSWSADELKNSLCITLCNGDSLDSYSMSYLIDNDPSLKLFTTPSDALNSGASLDFSSAPSKRYFLPDFVVCGEHTVHAVFESSSGERRSYDWTACVEYSKADRYRTELSVQRDSLTLDYSLRVSHHLGHPLVSYEVEVLLDGSLWQGVSYKGEQSSSFTADFSSAEPLVVSLPSIEAGEHVISVRLADDWGEGSTQLSYSVSDEMYRPEVKMDSSVSSRATTITVSPSSLLGHPDRDMTLSLTLSGREMGDITKDVVLRDGKGVAQSFPLTVNFSSNSQYCFTLPRDLYNDYYAVTATLTDGDHSASSTATWDEPIRDRTLDVYVTYDGSALRYAYEGVRLQSFKATCRSALECRWIDHNGDALSYAIPAVSWTATRGVFHLGADGKVICLGTGLSMDEYKAYQDDMRSYLICYAKVCGGDDLSSGSADTHILDMISTSQRKSAIAEVISTVTNSFTYDCEEYVGFVFYTYYYVFAQPCGAYFDLLLDVTAPLGERIPTRVHFLLDGLTIEDVWHYTEKGKSSRHAKTITLDHSKMTIWVNGRTANTDQAGIWQLTL